MNTQKRIWFTIFVAIAMSLVSISNANAQATPVDFRGTWNTVTGKGKKIVITFETVRRTTVTGTYARNGLTAGYKTLDAPVTAFVKVSAISGEPALQSASSIRGTVTDNVLRFQWLEDDGRGSGRFTMSADGRSFQGVFSKTDNPDDGSGGTWNGTRAPNFAGVWEMSGGPYPNTHMLFQEVGGQITGHLFAGAPPQGVINQGTIDGNTLRFTVVRPIPTLPGRPEQSQYMGQGEVVMAADGKTFSGKIFGVAATGTRIRR